MGAIQLLSLGIIGEYIRLIFLETKNRPTYIVAELKRHDTNAREGDHFPAPIDRLSLTDHDSQPSWDDP